MKITIRIVIPVILFWVGQAHVFAGVYQCAKSDGSLEFRDTPCQTRLETQTFLPLSYGRTDQKQLKKQESDLKKTSQQLTKLQKKQNRIQQKKMLDLNKEQNKAERQQARCLQIQEKIDRLDSQLQQGGKLKKYLKLQAQREQAERMKHRYCVSE